MYLNLLLIITLLLSCQNTEDQGFLFDVKYLENKIYTTSTKVFAKSEIDFEGPEETINKIKSSGMELPMLLDQDQITIMKIETFSKNEKGFMPFSGSLDSISTIQYINGKINTQDSPATIDTSFKISGHYNKDEMIIEKIKGNGIQPEMENALKSSIANMMKSIKFPEKPLKVGDSFSQSIPITIPVQGIVNVNMIVTTYYKLINIKDNIAYFDIEQDFELTSEANKAKISMSGSGPGKLIYDTKLYQITSMNTNSVMKMKVDAGEFFVISNSDTKTEMLIKVKDKI